MRKLEVMTFDDVPKIGYIISNNSEEHSAFNNFDTLIYILEGQLLYYNAYEEQLFKKGDVFFTSRFSNYKVRRIFEGESQNYRAVALVYDALDNLKNTSKTEDSDSSDTQLIFKIDSSEMKSLLQNIEHRFLEKQRLSNKEYRTLIEDIKTILSKTVPNELRALSRYKEDKFLTFLHKHINKNITLEKLAQKYGMSISSFQRIFKQRLGTSPHKWIKEQRLYKARFQMHYTQKPITQIYLNAGFEDLAHFSKEFKKKFGYSPSKTYGQVEVEVI